MMKDEERGAALNHINRLIVSNLAATYGYGQLCDYYCQPRGKG